MDYLLLLTFDADYYLLLPLKVFFFFFVEGISGISVYAVLLWTTSIEWLQVSQFLYGLYMATEVAYLTYIYAKVSFHITSYNINVSIILLIL